MALSEISGCAVARQRSGWRCIKGNMLLDGEKFAEGDIVLESVIT